MNNIHWHSDDYLLYFPAKGYEKTSITDIADDL